MTIIMFAETAERVLPNRTKPAAQRTVGTAWEDDTPW